MTDTSASDHLTKIEENEIAIIPMMYNNSKENDGLCA
jgi:hypothetical protein